MSDKNMKLFPLSIQIQRLQKIADHAGSTWENFHLRQFSDGETQVWSLRKVFVDMIFISFNQPVSRQQSWWNLIMAECLPTASANIVNVVMLLLGYARQDRDCCPRTNYCKLVANMLVKAGWTCRHSDLHAAASPRFLRYCRVDNLYHSAFCRTLH